LERLAALERQAIDDALQNLRVLKRKKLDYPDWVEKQAMRRYE